MIKKLLILILSFMLTFITYFSTVIYQADKYTKDVVLKDYRSNRWRTYEGKTYPLKIKFGDLSSSKLDWLIAVQDPGFYEHTGTDFKTPGGGLTTITQSLVKRIYFKNFEPGLSKIKQTLIAKFVVHGTISKRTQLELFLNSAYMGSFKQKEVYGFYDAAKVYYQKRFTALSGDEYLSLVAMLIAPNAFNVHTYPKENKERVSRIKQVILGEYIPSELMDVYYDH